MIFIFAFLLILLILSFVLFLLYVKTGGLKNYLSKCELCKYENFYVEEMKKRGYSLIIDSYCNKVDIKCRAEGVYFRSYQNYGISYPVIKSIIEDEMDVDGFRNFVEENMKRQKDKATPPQYRKDN